MQRGRLLSCLTVVIGLMCPSAPLFANVCSRPGQFYEIYGYVVTKITVQSPLDTSHLVQRYADGDGLSLKVRGSTPSSSGGDFVNAAFLESASSIAASLNAADRVGLSVVIPIKDKCDEIAKSIEVVYRVYHVGMPVQALGSTEYLQAPPVRITNRNGAWLLSTQPAIGYDASRHLFAGGDVELHSSKKAPIDDFYVAGYGSSSSMQLQAHFSGSQTWRRAPISLLQWGVTYVDEDLPTGAYAVSQRQLSARLAAVSQPNDRLGLVFHFGGAVEGGNQKSSGLPIPTSVGVLRSPLGSLKLYVGSSWTRHATSLTGSYGLQLGTAHSGAELDFMKHIVNGSVSTRLLPISHHPLSLDADFRAGWLISQGRIPISARFFGGDISTPFIAGDPWGIQSNPILRSFPGLTFAPSQGLYGGTSFASVSTNISYPVWVKPLVSDEIGQEVTPALVGQLNTGEALLADSYVADGAAYKAIESLLLTHQPSMRDLRGRLNEIKKESAASRVLLGAISDTFDDLDNADGYLGELNKRTSPDAMQPVRSLLVGEAHLNSCLSALAGDVDAVELAMSGAVQSADRRYIHGVAMEFRDLQATALAQLNAINRSAEDAKAKKSLEYPRHILRELTDSINLSSISPTLLFDVARLGPRPSTGRSDLRYGAGPAIRFGLINLDFTVGYSFNVRRRQGESPGAAVFALKFENLF